MKRWLLACLLIGATPPSCKSAETPKAVLGCVGDPSTLNEEVAQRVEAARQGSTEADHGAVLERARSSAQATPAFVELTLMLGSMKLRERAFDQAAAYFKQAEADPCALERHKTHARYLLGRVDEERARQP